MTLNERLGSRMLFFDGAMGTMLQAAGLPDGYAPDRWCVENPDAVRAVHRSYLDAGCDILKTDTFGANARKLAGSGYTVEEIVTAGVRLAQEAVADCGREAFVALDIGPSGKLLRPLGDLGFEQAVELFAQQVRAGAAAGADAVLIETMSDTHELKAAVLAAKENCSLPVFCTLAFDRDGKLLTGGDVETAVTMLEGLRPTAIGCNCGCGPTQMLPLIERMAALTSLPLIANPNAGLPREQAGVTVFDLEPAGYAAEMQPLLPYVWMAGGCCGTSPAHLKALIDSASGCCLQPRTAVHRTAVCSYAQTVCFERRSVLIGERLNPTGRRAMKEALRTGKNDYLVAEAVSQQGQGAQVLDVNVGLPEIDETERLPQAVADIQAVTPLPLQLDSSDPAALAAAMRLYNGKPMINSVSGKEDSMRAVFPLVQKYGGVLVALTLDEDGIPDTAEERLAIARRIMDTAAQYGIAKDDLMVDALTLPVSARPDAAEVTLQTVRLIKEQLGLKTVLGVSNVSFGLPQRPLVTAAFYAMALQSGLDAAIMNPAAEDMWRAYTTFNALTGRDDACADYIARYAQQPAAAPVAPSAWTLRQAVERGLREQAAALAANDTREPLTVINEELVPALDTVGRGFEQKTLFLPQLLSSAEAAKAAFEVLRQNIPAGEATGEKVVLATVKGDVHDIGKNIVKVLLENYRFDVMDLGRDVSPQAIADAVKKDSVRLCGLSALMTTTVPAMAETIRLLREQAPDCRVMVGGAVLTQDYADRIGADFYGADAMASVGYARRLFGI